LIASPVTRKESCRPTSPALAVHDHDEALAFYRDLLGLEVRNDVKYEGMRWTTVGPKGQPDVNIVLEPPLADPNASPADRKVMKEMLVKGLLRGVIFSTEDCDATEVLRVPRPVRQPDSLQPEQGLTARGHRH
jgi:catechol 2,3-dioxygenase-like lactoylglutathione lyase family enzyme